MVCLLAYMGCPFLRCPHEKSPSDFGSMLGPWSNTGGLRGAYMRSQFKRYEASYKEFWPWLI